MWLLGINVFLRFLLIILFITDLRMTYKLKKSDTTLHRELSAGQKRERVLYYMVLVIGLVVPFDLVYLIFVLLAFAYFFYFTDREIYVNRNAMYFRAQYYEFKRIENLTYEKHVLSFDYQNEHIKLSRPLLDDNMMEREVIHKVKKLKENSEKRKHKRNA